MLSSVMVTLMLLSCICAENPGIRVILTNKGLQYGKHAVAGVIQKKLVGKTLPDVTGSVDIKIGHVDYALTGLVISRCDFPEPSVEFFEGGPGLNSSISGLNLAINGYWSTHFGLIHDHGTVDIAIFNIQVNSAVKLDRDTGGHLSVTTVSCEAQVGDLDIKFHGGGSFIFQPFVDKQKSNIIEMIKTKICPTVEDQINVLESDLQAMNVSYNVNPVVSLDIPLTGSPIITASRMELGLKGEFYSIRTHQEPPFVAQPFTMAEEPDYMLSVGLSEFTANSASYGYFSAGVLQALITNNMIPSQFPIHLNTNSMGIFAPELPKLFPNMSMVLHIYAGEAPSFAFQPGVVNLDVQATMKVVAIEPNGTQIPLFTINSNSSFAGKFRIADEMLKGSILMDSFTLTLVSSEVGVVKIEALQNAGKFGINAAVIPKVNEIMEKGFYLPQTAQVQLADSVLNIEKGFLSIFSNLKIQAPEDKINEGQSNTNDL